MSQGVTAAVLYGVVSASMVFANKAVFASLHFPFPLVVLLLQMCVTAACLPLLTVWTAGTIELPRLSFGLARRFALPSALYCANVGMGLTSLGALSIPVYQVLKRLTPLASLVLASLVLGKRTTKAVAASCCAIVLGSMLVANGDVRFDGVGYTLALGSVVCQSLYLTLVQQQGQSGGELSSFGVLFVNSVNCIPLLAIATLLNGEAAGALAHPQLAALEPLFLAKLGLLLASGGALNYLLFLCTILNSALTTCIVGACKAVIVTALGFFVFGGQPLTRSMALGVALNTTGGVMYIFAKRKRSSGGGNVAKRPGLVLRTPAEGSALA